MGNLNSSIYDDDLEPGVVLPRPGVNCPRHHLTPMIPMEVCDGTTKLVCQTEVVWDNGRSRILSICGRNDSHYLYRPRGAPLPRR